jgi:hypothetical protein
MTRCGRSCQMVVDPPRQRFPVAGALVVGDEAVQDDASRGSHATVIVPPIPDVSPVVPLVRGAVVPHLIAKLIDLRRSKS